MGAIEFGRQLAAIASDIRFLQITVKCIGWPTDRLAVRVVVHYTAIGLPGITYFLAFEHVHLDFFARTWRKYYRDLLCNTGFGRIILDRCRLCNGWCINCSSDWRRRKRLARGCQGVSLRISGSFGGELCFDLAHRFQAECLPNAGWINIVDPESETMV